MRIILAGPRFNLGVPRRVADLPLIVEPGEYGSISLIALAQFSMIGRFDLSKAFAIAVK